MIITHRETREQPRVETNMNLPAQAALVYTLGFLQANFPKEQARRLAKLANLLHFLNSSRDRSMRAIEGRTGYAHSTVQRCYQALERLRLVTLKQVRHGLGTKTRVTLTALGVAAINAQRKQNGPREVPLWKRIRKHAAAAAEKALTVAAASLRPMGKRATEEKKLSLKSKNAPAPAALGNSCRPAAGNAENQATPQKPQSSAPMARTAETARNTELSRSTVASLKALLCASAEKRRLAGKNPSVLGARHEI